MQGYGDIKFRVIVIYIEKFLKDLDNGYRILVRYGEQNEREEVFK